MKEASTRAENATYDPSVPPQVVAKLRSVAKAFRELQFQRHLADYSNATKWDRIKASSKVNQSKTAFSDWKAIRNEYVAHDISLRRVRGFIVDAWKERIRSPRAQRFSLTP
jgi:hypothetical protein